MYLDNNAAYNKHVTTLKHKNNVRLNSGEIKKNGDRFEFVTCETSLSQYIVDQHFKTKTHLDNINPRSGFTDGKDKDNDKDKDRDNGKDKDTSGYCQIFNTRYDNKRKHNESDENKQNDKQKKLTDGKWREKRS